MTDRRFPASVYGHGSEPDPRFTLANERTFLAWIRTSLAFTAGGVALETLATGIPGPFRLPASLLLVAIGLALPVQAWVGWKRDERAMRTQQPLPAPISSLPISLGVTAAGLLIAAGIIVAGVR